MNRFAANITGRLLSRRAPAEPALPAVQTYRDQPGHLADAGGAYLVLPYGLVHTLNDDRQQHLVDVLTELATSDPRWAATTTYQVLPWARVHPGDLNDEELTWHGITSDIHPSTGAVTYSRGGKPLHPDTIVGHRPAPDPIRAPAGTYPGARPALLPAGPGTTNTPGAPATTPTGMRTERAQRMIETHRRRELLARHAPAADTHWAEAIIAADPLWGPDQEWKLLVERTTTRAPIPTPTGADDPDVEEAAEPASPRPHHTDMSGSGSGDDDADLAALEADLQVLFRP